VSDLAALLPLLDKLDRLAAAVERLADDYATVHRLRIKQCPECAQVRDGSGQLFHLSGCSSLWPDPAALRIPGEGL
jgi:hypothetical protein